MSEGSHSETLTLEACKSLCDGNQDCVNFGFSLDWFICFDCHKFVKEWKEKLNMVQSQPQ